MTVSDLTTLTAAEARRALDARDFSAVELAEAHFRRIDSVEGEIHAYLHLMRDVALNQAADADVRIAEGRVSPLTGVPVALKDILVTTDAPTTAASKILEGYRSPYDATVVSRLREQGAVFIGKTNTDEFAMGSSTENSAYGPTYNPWNTSRVPGGSSGGSAAAVAAREAVLALGSDTGGSIRQPAGFCGVVGLKPTYGRVSRFGLMAFASSLDQIGPFARSVEDAAIMLGAIAGVDPRDATAVAGVVPDYSATLRTDLKGVKVGIAREYRVSGMEPGVSAAIDASIVQ
ncbi:MAG TPA: amidase, partial [Thermomicrobiales bacterium]|nr:amidase [Thermomicrobiales bacterium]